MSNTYDYKLTEMLVKAARAGDLDECRRLLDAGADLRIEGDDTELPLHMAAMNGHLEVCKLFVERGDNIHARDAEGCPVLHSAVLSGNPALVAWLLDMGVDPNVYTTSGTTALHLVASDLVHDDPEGCVAVCKLLLERGANPEADDDDGDTAWSIVYADRYAPLVELFKPYIGKTLEWV